MDIFFCDECGSRVTDLDLRAGKGMRRRHDQICPQCVGQGLAAAWLARSGAAAAKAVANGSSAPAAVATAPDPIAIARDRALTQRDDPFGEDVLEPAPMAKVPSAPAPVHETDALPSRKPAEAPSARESSPFGDGFADAAGAMGALVGPLPSRQEGIEVGPGDDDLAERSDQDDDLDAMAATSPTAGVEPASEGVSAAKAETTAVPAKAEAKPEAKKGSSSRLSAAQKKNGGTSRRSTVTTPSRRVAPSPLASKKILVLSLVSCAVVAGLFFGVVVPNINKEKGPAKIDRQDLLVNFAVFVKDADTATKNAMSHPNDLDVQRKAIAAMRTMMSEYQVFEKAATKSGWKEDGFEAQLDNMKFHDIKGRMQPINQRIFILEQQGAGK